MTRGDSAAGLLALRAGAGTRARASTGTVASATVATISARTTIAARVNTGVLKSYACVQASSVNQPPKV